MAKRGRNRIDGIERVVINYLMKYGVLSGTAREWVRKLGLRISETTLLDRLKKMANAGTIIKEQAGPLASTSWRLAQSAQLTVAETAATSERDLTVVSRMTIDEIAEAVRERDKLKALFSSMQKHDRIGNRQLLSYEVVD